MSNTKRGRHALATRIHSAGTKGGVSGITGLGAVERRSDQQMRTRGYIGPLTARQAEVLALYDSGLREAEIARRLGVKSVANVLAFALLKSGR